MDTVHVFDVRLQGKSGPLHFDVMTTDQDQAVHLARHYLAGIGEADAPVTIKECQFCPQRTACHVLGRATATIPRTGRVHYHPAFSVIHP